LGIEEEAERCVRGVRAQQTGAGTRTLDLCEVGVGSAGLQQLRPLVRLVGELRDKAKHAVERGLERQKCLAGSSLAADTMGMKGTSTGDARSASACSPGAPPRTSTGHMTSPACGRCGVSASAANEALGA